ncbi:hypothetical protein NL676_029155 [Syzygium grande]|nr:hypothetical protein NL676_029155 [Syzygium grande]
MAPEAYAGGWGRATKGRADWARAVLVRAMRWVKGQIEAGMTLCRRERKRKRPGGRGYAGHGRTLGKPGWSPHDEL